MTPRPALPARIRGGRRPAARTTEPPLLTLDLFDVEPGVAHGDLDEARRRQPPTQVLAAEAMVTAEAVDVPMEATVGVVFQVGERPNHRVSATRPVAR